MTVLGEATVAFCVTAVALVPVIAVLRRLGVVDRPTTRSSHDRPTLRGGGAAVALGAFAALIASSSVGGDDRIGLLVAAVGFGLIGLVDDIRGAGAPQRLIAQAVVGFAAVPWLIDGSMDSWLLVVAVAGCTAFWLVAYVNAFNFMDGINGIAAAQTIVAGSAWAIIGGSQGASTTEVGGIIIGAAALAFAPVNFPRARVFLGDGGSYFVGAWLAVVVVFGLRASIPAEAVLAPVSLCVLDTGTTLVRRVIRGERWFEAHREHTYQRVVALGLSHASTTAFVTVVVTLCSLLGGVSLLGNLAARLCADAGIVLLLLGYLFSPKWLNRSAASA